MPMGKRLAIKRIELILIKMDPGETVWVVVDWIYLVLG
jgi:hypothetical protein